MEARSYNSLRWYACFESINAVHQKQTKAVHIVVDESGQWRDPALVATEVVQASDIAFCSALIEKCQL